MISSKQVICPERLRQTPTQFSWVDQRLVRDRHLDHLDVAAAALYLFLVTVADGQGLSWYGDTSIARRLSIDAQRLLRARGDLIGAGLVAYAKPLYQVLDLSNPLPPPLPPAPPAPPPAPVAPDRAVVREHLAALHTALGKRP